jgi:Eukaryotic initiation factor 4E
LESCTAPTADQRACSLFNNILTPADLDDRASIFFFEEGVKPDWDEEETQHGGLWQVPIKQKGQDGKAKLEMYWADVVRFLRIVLCCVFV